MRALFASLALAALALAVPTAQAMELLAVPRDASSRPSGLVWSTSGFSAQVSRALARASSNSAPRTRVSSAMSRKRSKRSATCSR